ncbi:MAG: HDOD domain-containing protein [Gemmataceae bacterium]|nr:HDOD domain-containing protein [Gemmataceae bacterium]
MTRRVLFVADEPLLLESLRRTLLPLQAEWELRFARGASEGLARLDEAPYDVLVADAQLRSLAADDLLAEVRRRHPRAVRIVLAAEGDRLRLLKLVSLAHRVLTKPCSPEELRTAIRRACTLQDLLASPSLAAVVGRMGSVPTLPILYTQIVQELARPDYSIEVVGELIGRDLGMAAKLIQMANSALVGLRWPVSTPAQAVRILGAEWTRSLALAAGVFSRYDPSRLRPFSIEELWEHSRRVASLAGRIAAAERAGDRVIRDAALAGLFHDIGRLTLASQLPGPYREVMARMDAAGLSAVDAERELLGATHAEVGAYLLGLWGLPDPLVEAVAWHHTPSKCPGRAFTPLTAVHAADALAHSGEQVPDLVYLTRLGLERRLPAWAGLAESTRVAAAVGV